MLTISWTFGNLSRFTDMYLVFVVFQTKVAHSCFCLVRIKMPVLTYIYIYMYMLWSYYLVQVWGFRELSSGPSLFVFFFLTRLVKETIE